MGQQQLILLILAAVIVGLAIIVGMNIFSSGAVEAAVDAVRQDNMTIASRAIAYADRPIALGGQFDPVAGVGSFNGITLTEIGWEEDNVNGHYTISGEGTSCDIEGTVHKDGTVVTTTVTIAQNAEPTISTVVVRP